MEQSDCDTPLISAPRGPITLVLWVNDRQNTDAWRHGESKSSLQQRFQGKTPPVLLLSELILPMLLICTLQLPGPGKGSVINRQAKESGADFLSKHHTT